MVKHFAYLFSIILGFSSHTILSSTSQQSKDWTPAASICFICNVAIKLLWLRSTVYNALKKSILKGVPLHIMRNGPQSSISITYETGKFHLFYMACAQDSSSWKEEVTQPKTPIWYTRVSAGSCCFISMTKTYLQHCASKSIFPNKEICRRLLGLKFLKAIFTCLWSHIFWRQGTLLNLLTNLMLNASC